MMRVTVMQRPGTTFVELILFLAFFAVVSGVLISFFFATTEQRVRQGSIASVEQAGIQMTQALKNRIRSAERILDPPLGSSGPILALQLADSTIHPTIIGLSGSALMVGQGSSLQQLSPSTVTVSDLQIVNTSPTADRGSVLVKFTVTRAIPLTTPLSYSRDFEILVSLFPDDVESTQCGCTAPACTTQRYTWEYCEEETCHTASGSLPCL